MQGGRFEVAVVGHRQPKITVGRWGGWDPGGQPLTWLAALLVSPVLRPGAANEKPEKSCHPRPGFLRVTFSFLVQSRAFRRIIVALGFFKQPVCWGLRESGIIDERWAAETWLGR